MAETIWVAPKDKNGRFGRPRIVADLAHVRDDLAARGFVEVEVEDATGRNPKEKAGAPGPKPVKAGGEG